MPTGEPRRERKVVTVLFCDLVGFTQRAEQLDPEDVEALLSPYHERLRSELERYGGTVEKFIGDAVMALFGAPVAHEDDAERAVRACLAIRDWAVEGDDVQVRIAVTTGEALIRLDARPEAGEGMASGDVVNTAARLQNAAPVNGILADETTYRATRQVVDYREARSVEAKGKSEPIPVWEALSARARFGVDIAHEARTELVGREREVNIVRDAFERARHERTPQLLTLVGVPGMGKSRLVYELSRIVDADPELIAWRQGRCLAYGDGVTLWALGEIVKAQAGIVEQDTPPDAAEKLRLAAADALPESDAAWVESHLLALIGLGVERELGGDRRNEAFSAWRRFLEGLAEQHPLILIFEDLHWADESLLDFVDELVDWVTDAPLLVVATARPELLERRPGWGGGKLNATTLALSPLSEDETALLLSGLLGRPVLTAESQQALLERAGGNPLYAEQFAELYVERGSTEELPVPETLHGLIAARLDGLGETDKGLVLDAAVVGKVFWAGSLGRNGDDIVPTLHSLERKGFVRRQRRSSVEGEIELAFAHALVRDVAYGQIPRAERAAKHRRVAEWIESLGRPDDHAEMVAHHWQAALEFARAAGEDGSDLAERTRLALRDAGDRAFALNAYPTAEKYYADALDLWPDADSERPDLLFRRARSLHLAADDRRQDALEEARDALLATGAAEPAAEAEAFLGHGAWYRGDRNAAEPHFSRAYALVADRGATSSKARVLAFSARFRMLAGDAEEAIRVAQKALTLAEELSLDELRAHALTTIGSSKSRIDLSSGRAELEEALVIALAADSPTAAVTLNNLAVLAIWEEGFARASEIYPEAQQIAERYGDRDGLRFMRGNEIFAWWVVGRWDEASAAADAFVAECVSSPHYAEGIVRDARASIRLAKGDVAGAAEDREFVLEHAHRVKDPQRLLPSLAATAVSLVLLNREDEARTVAEETLALTRENVDLTGAVNHLVLVAGRLGIRDELRKIVDLAPNGPWKDLLVAGTDGDLERVSDLYSRFGAPTFEAYARLFGGEDAIAGGRRAEGEAQIARALAFYRSVDAQLLVRHGEGLLASAYSDSA